MISLSLAVTLHLRSPLNARKELPRVLLPSLADQTPTRRSFAENADLRSLLSDHIASFPLSFMGRYIIIAKSFNFFMDGWKT